MELKQIKTNEHYIQVKPDKCFLTPDQQYYECERIVRDINRHVDNIEVPEIKERYMYETPNGKKYRSIADAIGAMFGYPIYKYYARGTDRRTPQYMAFCDSSDFREIVEFVYDYPYELHFRGLTEDEINFLNKVSEWRLKQ